MLIPILFVIPIFIIFSAIVMYHFTGKKEIFKMDIVQFVYTFILGPITLIWLKSFVYFLLKNELGASFSIGQYIIIDTFIAIVFLYLFTFIVIHSLTKSFNLNQQKDPWSDINEIMEYFHMDFSHIGIYLGASVLGLVLGIINIIIPFTFFPASEKTIFYLLIFVALISGAFNVVAIYSYNSDSQRFIKILKLLFAGELLINIVIYFLVNPTFSFIYGLYWFIFAIQFSTVSILAFSEKKDSSTKIPFRMNFKKIKKYLLLDK